MATSMREHIRENKSQEVINSINTITQRLAKEGYSVEFGNIGKKSTYALIYNPASGEEYVGYTFVRDLRYYQENTGKLKALEQALVRKENY